MSWIATVIQVASVTIAATVAWIGIAKGREELQRMQRSRRREDFEYAMKVADAFDDADVRRYAEKAAYAGLTRDRHLTHEQRKVLLRFDDSFGMTERYMRTRAHVEVVQATRSIEWRKRLRAPWRRTALQWGLGMAYAACWLMAAGPWLFWIDGGMGALTVDDIVPQALSSLVFAALAVYCVVRARVLIEAKTLMDEMATLTERSDRF